MRAPRAELHHVAAQRRLHHPRRLGRDGGLEPDHRQQVRLRNLRFNHGSADRQKWLTGKYRRALRHREQVAGEAQFSQHLEKCGARVAELRNAAEVRNFLRQNAEVEQVFHCLRQPRSQDEIAIIRQPPHGEFEGRAILSFPGLEVAGGHGELVKIGNEAKAHYFFFSG